MDKESITSSAANFIATKILGYVESGVLDVGPEGKVIFPLQPVGWASVQFPFFSHFRIHCPICQSGWIQPVEEVSPLSFLRAILSDTRRIKLKGFRCESKSCVLHKQIIPKAMVMEILARKQQQKEVKRRVKERRSLS
jgi:hypothetical protein